MDLQKKAVDIIVFWTKNPRPLMKRLKEIEDMGHKYYFQFTLTPYDKSIEEGLPEKEELMETFMELSETIGKNKVIWRYDPIITGKLNASYHEEMFGNMAHRLKGYTERCYISFFDEYNNVKRKMSIGAQYSDSKKHRETVASKISPIARENQMNMYTCAEEIDLEKYNIEKGSCINREVIENILHCNVQAKKDENQRKECRCLKSIEIGSYDSCNNGCRYCYANSSAKRVADRIKLHDKEAEVLIGTLPEDATITKRENQSVADYQLNLFDRSRGNW